MRQKQILAPFTPVRQIKHLCLLQLAEVLRKEEKRRELKGARQ
jgi:hypothetical protein